MMKLTTRKTFAIVLFLSIFVMTVRPALDPDLWWHLRTGELIIETGIPASDPFSHIAEGLPWTTHEWLSDVLLQYGFQAGGLLLLVLAFSLLITCSYFVMYLSCPSSTRPYAAGFSVLLAALASAPLWGVRPQMLTLLLSAITFFSLESYRQHGRLIFIVPLPFILLLWVNLHAGYFIGLAIIGTFLAGQILENILNRQSVWANNKSILSLFGTLVVGLIFILINPNGTRILLYPFETLYSQSMMMFIQEWFSPDFHKAEWLPLAVLLLAVIGAGYLGNRRIPITHLLLILGSGFAALQSMRHAPLFALMTIPVLAAQIGPRLVISSAPHIRPRLSAFVNLILVLVICLAGIFRISTLPEQQRIGMQETYPTGAADWIRANDPDGEIYNTYRWGGYLIWRLFPDYKVFIDGRADVYGDQLIYEYMNIYTAQPGWESMLIQRDVRIVLIEAGEPLALALDASPQWELAYQDALSTVYILKGE